MRREPTSLASAWRAACFASSTSWQASPPGATGGTLAPAPFLDAGRRRAARRASPVNPSTDEPSSEVSSASDAEPMNEPELRREIWRLRDQVFGLEVERSRLQSALLECDAARRTAQNRGDALELARVQRDAMLGSTRWKIGGAIVKPFRIVQRLFSAAKTR